MMYLNLYSTVLILRDVTFSELHKGKFRDFSDAPPNVVRQIVQTGRQASLGFSHRPAMRIET